MCKQEKMTEVYDKVGGIIKSLSILRRKADIEAVFTRNGVTDYSEKIDMLRKCMGVIGVANNNEEISIEDDYTDELEIFCEGSWRFIK
ncbi:MAG: hypothetical protein LBG72_04515 [Spirochaetaceae bacterium]|jgi:hypothetical protein|nr:hypothetical protein [Spirochaetaceae bacterium]